MRKSRNSIFILFFIAAVVIALFSPYASQNPDGLDWTVEKYRKTEALVERPPGGAAFLFADYKVPFIKSEPVSTVVSAIAGVIIVLALFRVLSAFISRRREERSDKAVRQPDNAF